MKFLPICACLTLALAISACERPAESPKDTIAFIDLDGAAKRLGRDVALAEELKTENDTLAQKLIKERDEMQAKFNESLQSAGSKPSDEDTKKLQALEQTLNQQLQARQQAAREELSTKQADLIRQFREEVKPVAQKIAAAKGMKTVLVRSDIVALSIDPAADITDDVVAEMISSGKGTAAPSPSASPSPTATP